MRSALLRTQVKQSRRQTRVNSHLTIYGRSHEQRPWAPRRNCGGHMLGMHHQSLERSTHSFERGSYAALILCADAYTGISHGKPHLIFSVQFLDQFCLDLDPPTGSEFKRIADEIVENLSQTHWVDQQYGTDLWVNAKLDQQAFATGDPRVDATDSLDDFLLPFSF